MALILSAISIFAVFGVFAKTVKGNEAHVEVDSDLTYYLKVKEDGVDAAGVESSDTQIANVRGGRVAITDRIPDGLIFQGFVTTSNGLIGAVSRADGVTACSGKVVDDTKEETLDAGTWNDAHTEYFYHGLHYNDLTRTVSFTAERIKAGCELTVGIITKTPATVDDPDTAQVETRRDFYNSAFAAEKDLTAVSNTVHAWIGSLDTQVYKVRYSYTGDVPTGAPTAPVEQSYAADSAVAVSTSPSLQGYTFSGWTTEGATVTDNSFTMPSQDVEFTGIWTKNTAAAKYNVTYVINGDKPADFMPPAQKEYEAGTTVDLDSTEKDAMIDGYRFSGWSTQDVTLSEAGFTMPAQNVTITGSFERVSYTVCYEFEGAILPPNADTLLPACETHYPGDTVTRAANPQADGYEFLGWYKNETFTMPEKNVVIQGEWGQAMDKFAPAISKSIV
ncbi:MAG: InlB B-repeat-containing protein, partial [Candidatus Saccharibacteria bacterium]|nr:InlB B-repeat-containing protein [Candidatus Saccharibacteria bacterium]